MLLDYFRESKYKVLLQWVSIAYPKKLELSLDKTKALQQTKLKTPSGVRLLHAAVAAASACHAAKLLVETAVDTPHAHR